MVTVSKMAVIWCDLCGRASLLALAISKLTRPKKGTNKHKNMTKNRYTDNTVLINDEQSPEIMSHKYESHCSPPVSNNYLTRLEWNKTFKHKVKVHGIYR
jgi:hypothetical protein